MAIRKVLMTGIALAGLCGAAGAADYMPIYGGGTLIAAPELKPVEIGTGWYLRGDVSYDFDTDFDGSLIRTAPDDFVATTGFDGLSLDEGYSVGLGFGYQFTDMFRGDLTARYARSDLSGFAVLGCPEDEDDCSAIAGGGGRSTSWELMANAYVDLGTVAGFTPYVGGGLGAVNVEFERGDFSCGEAACSDIAGQDDWRFAYALMAGVGYNINRSLTLDLGYRYLNVDGGDQYAITTGAGDATNSFLVSDDGFDRHTITAGLRYSLW